MKPVVVSNAAAQDIDGATDYYADIEIALAEGWLASVQRGVADIGRQPRLGSPLFAERLGITGLRHKLVRKFPYLMFYIEREREIVIVRVLHERRDVATEVFTSTRTDRAVTD